MRIDLTEWESTGGLDLTPATVHALAKLTAVRIAPDPVSTRHWRLRATNYVGVARIAELETHIRPKIRPDRLVELLTASLDRIAWDEMNVEWAEADDLVGAISGAFLVCAERALRGGIQQGYVTEEADLYGLRGRIDLGRQMARNPGALLPVAVTYDDYTLNILENQLIVGAGRALLRLPGLTNSLAHRLRRLEHQLAEVTPARPSANPPMVVWTRLNSRYRSAVTLSRIILQWGMISVDEPGSTEAPGFLVDMNRVFEDVVGLGLREALTPGLRVELQRGDYLDTHRRVPIRPDIRVLDGVRTIAVADVKYKRVGTHGVSSDDVYQALAYATRYGLPACTLVYPEAPPMDRLEVGGITINLVAVEIDQPAPERQVALKALARFLAAPAFHR